MSAETGIEWTDATWNPVTGCTKVSAGCDHCYAQTFAERFRGVAGHHFEVGFDLVLRPGRLTQPLRWTRGRRIFVNSMSDLFHDAVPDEYIARVFAVMAAAPLHTFQVLTKRHARAHSLLGDPGFEDLIREEWDELIEAGTPGAAPCPGWGWFPLRNVWLGVSVEDQRWAEIRIPALLDTPAAVRFMSAEPLLGPIGLRPRWLHSELCPMSGGGPVCACCPGDARLDWVITGGESGPKARPMDPAWPRSLRDQCGGAGVAFFFKQWGEHRPPQAGEDERMVRVGKKHAGRVLDGRTWDEFPDGAR